MEQKQKEFGLVGIMIVLARVAVLCALVWWVWHNGFFIFRGSEGQTVSQNTKVAEGSLPKGWIEYKNEKFGFTFAYPEKWGKVSVRESEFPHTGTHSILTFSKEKDFRVAFKSLDYKYTGSGSGVPPVYGFGNYETTKNELLNFSKNAPGYKGTIYKNQTNYLTYSTADLVGSNFVVAGIHNAKKFPGLNFGFVLPMSRYNLSSDQLDKINRQEINAENFLTYEQIDIVNIFATNIKIK